MTKLASRRLRRVLLGSAGAALTVMLAAGAQAQSSATATGARSIANQQSAIGSTTLADASNAAIGASTDATVSGARISVSDEVNAATARANQVDQAITADTLALSGAGPTSLTADANGASADGGAAIANRQSRDTASAAADIFGSVATIAAGDVSTTSLELSRNSENTLGVGSDAKAAIALTGSTSDSGAGIANQQTASGASNVASRTAAATALRAGTVSASQLDSSDNLDRALAYGNRADDSVSATVGAVTLPADTRTQPVAMLAPGAAPAPVTAPFAILNDQTGSGTVKARSGDGNNVTPTFGTSLTGEVSDASVTSDRNTQVAASYGNSVTNGIALNTTSTATSPGAGNSGSVAAIDSIQRAGGSSVEALSLGSNRIIASQGVSGSTLSTSDGTLATAATVNASGNTLTVTGDSIEVPGAPGAALVKPDGSVTGDAAFSVQNIQDTGTSTASSAQYNNNSHIGVTGALSTSMLSVDRDAISSAATGNAASNSAAVDAASLQGTVAVNNLQTGDGSVSAAMGIPSDHSGAGIVVGGAVHDSALSVSGNTDGSTAIANSASNTLTATGVAIAPGAPHGSSVAGAVGEDYGATADLALASNQKVGDPAQGGTLIPAIIGNVLGDFAISAGGPIERGTLTVADNAQRAQAVANTVANRLAVSATSLDAGSALSSSQYGQATVAASSDARFTVTGNLAGAATSLSGNANSALGVMNDGDNALNINTLTSTGSDGELEIGSSPFGPPSASGDHVLASQQFAIGSVSGTAATRVTATGTGTGLNNAGVTIDDNQAAAEATANRVTNAASLSATSGTADIGLVNMQMNAASVAANANGTIDDAVSSPASTPIIGAQVDLDNNETTALARGNAATNAVTFALGTPGNSAPAVVEVGRFEAEGSADAALVNTQTNAAPVTAAAVTTVGVPLNAGGVRGTSIGITGNSVTASGYGNSAINSLTVSGIGALPSAGIANLQSNNGAVTAQVTGSAFSASMGVLAGSEFGITGNSLAATAVGNQASSAIASHR